MNLFKEFFIGDNYIEIDLLTCPPYEALKYTKAIITGGSATIAEAESAGIPYFVYESKESGYVQSFLSDESNKDNILYTDIDKLIEELSVFLNK